MQRALSIQARMLETTRLVGLLDIRCVEHNQLADPLRCSNEAKSHAATQDLAEGVESKVQ